jgi:hypothetical protein
MRLNLLEKKKKKKKKKKGKEHRNPTNFNGTLAGRVEVDIDVNGGR